MLRIWGEYFMKKIFFLLLCATLFACAPASSPPSLSSPVSGIVGGQEIKANEFQDNPMAAATVAVLWSDDEAGRAIQCTGTLIASDVVLTAAHCLMDVKNPVQIQIDFLTVSLENSLGFPKMLAKKFFVSPLYRENVANKKADWGLILLPQPAPAGTVIAAVAPRDWKASFFQPTFALGYGNSYDRI
jgi:secreted trypsin-like serine protease